MMVNRPEQGSIRGDEKRRRPFQDMTAEGWQNLALAGLLLFYIFYTALQMINHTMCGQIGMDYCAYWSAGRVANLYGYAQVYDLGLLGQIERSILPAAADPSLFAVNPMAYLPIFVVPFQLLSLLTPEAGYWIWTTINLAAFALYLRHFTRRMGQRPATVRLLLLVLASLPIYLNMFAGQVGVWLAICSGEFLLALSAGKPFRAGLWLGGLLVKPHLLVLIGLVLLLQRAARTLAGLAATSSILLAACLLLGGPNAVMRMLELWLIQATGSGYSGVWLEGQMNWRMLAFHLSPFADPRLGTGIAAIGMLATLIITLYVWRRPFDLRESSPAIAVLGLFAASAVLAWHSHINTAMLLIPALLYLHQARVLPPKALACWVLLPALLFVAVTFMPQILGRLGLFSEAAGRLIYFFIGGAEFAVTLYLFWWAADAYRRRQGTRGIEEEQ